MLFTSELLAIELVSHPSLVGAEHGVLQVPLGAGLQWSLGEEAVARCPLHQHLGEDPACHLGSDTIRIRPVQEKVQPSAQGQVGSSCT